MIQVSSGHENSVGVEVFLKAFSLLRKDDQQKFTLHISKKALKKIIYDYKWDAEFNKESLFINGFELKCYWVDAKINNSIDSLESSLALSSEKSEILLTLPTTKEQLIFKNKTCKGYTEYFRKRYNNENLTMIFKNKSRIFVLLSDHIPLKEVPSFLTPELVESKISISLESIQKYFFKIQETYLLGINPHAGEEGLLGLEEKIYESSLNKWAFIKGPLSGDTAHNYFNKLNQIFIFSFHDQALSLFKSKYGMLGSNITLGMDFLRMSVDHGTAFSLYGKNKADCMGCYHVMLEALRVKQE